MTHQNNRSRKIAFCLTNLLEAPLDLYKHLPFQVAVVSNLLQLNRDVEIKAISTLEPRELRVILNIGSYMPIKAADISYQARLDSYTVSRAVKTLKQEGLIDCEVKASNRKVKNLVLTEAGISLYAKLCKAIEARTATLESVLSTDEKNQLMILLSKIEDKAEDILASNALARSANNNNIPADQKEIIRWHKKSKESA